MEPERLRSGGYAEMMRMIRDEEPPRPSLKISSLGEKATVVAKHRGTDPRALSQSLRGELDWIVMKALDKERERRFETCNDFAADVQRYLNDETVLACPPSSAYRLRKLFRRNRAAFVTTAVVAVALLMGTALASWQAVVATRQRDRAMHAEAIARAETEAKEKARAAAAKQKVEAEQAKAQAEQRLVQMNKLKRHFWVRSSRI